MARKIREQKRELAARTTKDGMDVFDYGGESVSVAMEEVRARDWMEKVYKPDIQNKRDRVYTKPGYDPSEL